MANDLNSLANKSYTQDKDTQKKMFMIITLIECRFAIMK